MRNLQVSPFTMKPGDLVSARPGRQPAMPPDDPNAIPSWLLAIPFVVEYNPYVGKKFLVRLGGHDRGEGDGRQADSEGARSKEAVGLGDTLAEAAAQAVQERMRQTA